MIQESGAEIDELTSSTWATAVAGRRLYPRIKRYVADAWKMIQMERDEWEFKAVEFSHLVNPRFKYTDASGPATAPFGTVFVGDESGFTFTVAVNLVDQGAWTDGDAVGQLEFITHSGDVAPVIGESFTGGAYSFVYTGRGSYDFGLYASDLNEIQWHTMVVATGNKAPAPLIIIPWDNWQESAFASISDSTTPPVYATQDPLGRVVFYAQTLETFRVQFVYNATPQELTNYTDVPDRMPAHYHEWISWEAVMMLATYDKNMSLYNHALKHAMLYRKRADKNLMPKVSWMGNPYYE